MPKSKSVLGTAAVAAVLFGIVIGTPALSAQEPPRGRVLSRLSIAAAGGMGRTEDHQGLADLSLGVRYRIAPTLRIGLGAGYLRSERHGYGHDMDRSWNKQGFPYGMDGRTEGRDFRVKAATADIIYALPLGRKWNLTIGGSAGRYFGEFPGPSGRVHRTSWGGRAGLGAELRLSARLSAFAEAAYRFLEFHDIPAPFQPIPLAQVKESARPMMEMINRGLAMWMPARMEDLSLNGPSMRLGLSFGL